MHFAGLRFFKIRGSVVAFSSYSVSLCLMYKTFFMCIIFLSAPNNTSSNWIHHHCTPENTVCQSDSHIFFPKEPHSSKYACLKCLLFFCNDPSMTWPPPSQSSKNRNQFPIRQVDLSLGLIFVIYTVYQFFLTCYVRYIYEVLWKYSHYVMSNIHHIINVTIAPVMV